MESRPHMLRPGPDPSEIKTTIQDQYGDQLHCRTKTFEPQDRNLKNLQSRLGLETYNSTSLLVALEFLYLETVSRSTKLAQCFSQFLMPKITLPIVSVTWQSLMAFSLICHQREYSSCMPMVCHHRKYSLLSLPHRNHF